MREFVRIPSAPTLRTLSRKIVSEILALPFTRLTTGDVLQLEMIKFFIVTALWAVTTNAREQFFTVIPVICVLKSSPELSVKAVPEPPQSITAQ